jgi:hypothetical protein
MPAPGRDAPLPNLAKLVTLTSFNLTSTPDGGPLLVSAHATAPNPVPEGTTLDPPPLPFVVALPGATPSEPALPLARVRSRPFALTRPNISLALDGAVLPFPSDAAGGANATRLFSRFLQAYLAGSASPILVSSPLFPQLVLETEFPPPHPKPQILRDVQLKDLKLRPSGATWLASGSVNVKVVLPRGMRIKMDVRDVLPDVLIFDGPVPAVAAGAVDVEKSAGDALRGPGDEEPKPTPPAPGPLPDPLPARAFAHIRPEDWLDALSVPYETGDPNVRSHLASRTRRC